jgi:hypothetical protein
LRFYPLDTPLNNTSQKNDDLLSKVVFQHLNQAATWSTAFTSIPSLNLIHSLEGLNDAHRDFTTIGNQHLVNFSHYELLYKSIHGWPLEALS